MTYEETLARLASMGPELRTGKSRRSAQVVARPHPHSAARARGSASRLPLRPHRRHQRQGFDRRHARLDPQRCRPAHRPLHLAAPAPRQRAHPPLRRQIHRSSTRFPTTTSPSSSHSSTPRPPRSSRTANSRIRPASSNSSPPSPSAIYAEQGIDIAVLEVGLGGRLDATNVVDPLLSIITDIGIDHTEFLGNTLRSIATEKAGILRENGVLVTLSQHPEANAAIGEAALALNVRGVDASRFLPPRGYSGTEPESIDINTSAGSPWRNRYPISIDGKIIEIDSPLAGQHQQRNIALAVAAAIELRTNHGFSIPNAAIEQGIRNTEWPGRLEWIPSTRRPRAHPARRRAQPRRRMGPPRRARTASRRPSAHAHLLLPRRQAHRRARADPLPALRRLLGRPRPQPRPHPSHPHRQPPRRHASTTSAPPPRSSRSPPSPHPTPSPPSPRPSSSHLPTASSSPPARSSSSPSSARCSSHASPLAHPEPAAHT